MWRLLLERTLSLVLKLLGMAVILFIVTHLLPADPAAVAAGTNARPEQVEAMRKDLGLDRPVPEQFLEYVWGLLQGDLGESLRTRHPVVDDLAVFFPATLELALFAAAVIVLVGIPLGILAAVYSGTIIDYGIRLFVVTGMGIPAFALGLLLQLVFARWLGWFPLEGRLDTALIPPPHVTGMYTVDSLLVGDWAVLRSSLQHLVLPVTALAIGRLAVGSRFTRNSMLETLSQSYIRTARAKGLDERTVIVRHALRNALIPVITVLGIQIGFLLGGAVLVEVVFTWPGLGRYAVESALSFDFFGVIGAALIIAVMFVVSNTVVDLLYTRIDPRIEY